MFTTAFASSSLLVSFIEKQYRYAVDAGNGIAGMPEFGRK